MNSKHTTRASSPHNNLVDLMVGLFPKVVWISNFKTNFGLDLCVGRSNIQMQNKLVEL